MCGFQFGRASNIHIIDSRPDVPRCIARWQSVSDTVAKGGRICRRHQAAAQDCVGGSAKRSAAVFRQFALLGGNAHQLGRRVRLYQRRGSSTIARLGARASNQHQEETADAAA